MYPKGGNMLHTIRAILDDDAKWRDILRGLNKTFYHQTVTGKQVQDYISREAGLDLSKVFAQYLTRPRSLCSSSGAGSTLSYHWATSSGFDMPVRVQVPGLGTRCSVHRSVAELGGLSGAGELSVDENFYVTASASVRLASSRTRIGICGRRCSRSSRSRPHPARRGRRQGGSAGRAAGAGAAVTAVYAIAMVSIFAPAAADRRGQLDGFSIVVTHGYQFAAPIPPSCTRPSPTPRSSFLGIATGRTGLVEQDGDGDESGWGRAPRFGIPPSVGYSSSKQEFPAWKNCAIESSADRSTLRCQLVTSDSVHSPPGRSGGPGTLYAGT